MVRVRARIILLSALLDIMHTYSVQLSVLIVMLQPSCSTLFQTVNLQSLPFAAASIWYALPDKIILALIMLK